jgi:hypothetical protein
MNSLLYIKKIEKVKFLNIPYKEVSKKEAYKSISELDHNHYAEENIEFLKAIPCEEQTT